MANDGLTVQIGQILTEYQTEIDEKVEQVFADVAKEAVKRLKDASPKDRPEYYKGWTTRKEDDKTITVYNATHPGLTHLLEESHAIKNQPGGESYGRTSPGHGQHIHIKPVEEWANDEIIRRLEGEL